MWTYFKFLIYLEDHLTLFGPSKQTSCSFFVITYCGLTQLSKLTLELASRDHPCDICRSFISEHPDKGDMKIPPLSALCAP